MRVVPISVPRIWPLISDFSLGFPPIFLEADILDLFLSNTVRMHRVLSKANMEVELYIFEAMFHGGFGDAPEGLELGKKSAVFFGFNWIWPKLLLRPYFA